MISFFFHFHHHFDGWGILHHDEVRAHLFHANYRKGSTGAIMLGLVQWTLSNSSMPPHFFPGFCCKRQSGTFYEPHSPSLTPARAHLNNINKMFQHIFTQTCGSTGISPLNMDKGQPSNFKLLLTSWKSLQPKRSAHHTSDLPVVFRELHVVVHLSISWM